MLDDLSPLATRLLGCLLEKERTTPEAYPLTLNSLMAAANQTTNRDPIMAASADEVETALDELRGQKLAALVMMAGARVSKFRHVMLDEYDLQPSELALLCTLLLRGPQTAGELKSRSDRLHGFSTIEDVEETLRALGTGDEPLVRQLPARPGQKGARWVQLFSGEPPAEEFTPATSAPREPSRLEQLQERVQTLETEMAELREEFRTFRQQFES